MGQQTNKQTKAKQSKRDKNLQKHHLVHFMLANYFSWAWGLPCSMVNTPSETQSEKTNFSFANCR